MRPRNILITGAALGAGFMLYRKIALKEDLDWRSIEKPGAVVEIDGYGVHYIEQGHGPAIVLLHGFGGSTYSYRHLIPVLAAAHRVIAVDLKGFGLSQRDATAGLSQTAQVAMLKELLERSAVDRAVLVGHSMGGAIAMRFAAAHPAMVEALVLAASASGDELRGQRTHARISPPRALLRPLLPLLAGVASSRLLSMMYHDRSKITPDVRDAYLLPGRIRGSMDGLMAMLRDRGQDAPIDYSRIMMPVLLLCGAHDAVVPRRVAEGLRERIPQARIVVIEDSAHGLLEEQPAACLEAIDDFLRAARDPDAAGSAAGAASSS